MAISTNDTILKFGTQVLASSGTPAAIASGGYGLADQAGTALWSNTDNAVLASAVLRCQFATMPTVGSLKLIARILNIQGANHMPIPDANFHPPPCGSFEIDFGSAVATNMFLPIPMFRLPPLAAAQRIDWYILNDGTSETLTSGWALWIGPSTVGPKP